MWSKCRWVSSAVACIGRAEGPHLPVQDVAAGTQPGAQVDDERLVPLDVDHQARGVAPVAPVAIPRARARPPHAVERDVHPRDVTLPRRCTFCAHGSITGHRQRAGVRLPDRRARPTGRSPSACTASPTRRTPGATCCPSWPAAGYHAVAPFLRGYAPTAVPADGRYQVGALVRDANALHEVLGGGDDAVLIGHDWGALATYGAVAHQPARWRRAVTAAVPPTASIGMSLLHLRAAPLQLVHVLLPVPAGRGGAPPR